MTKVVEVYAEATPNPGVMKFVTNQHLTDGVYEFRNVEEAAASPLAQKLFYFPFVKEVFLSANFISIQKFETIDWQDVMIETRSFIREWLMENDIVVLEGEAEDRSDSFGTHVQSDDELSQAVVQILDEYVQPAVASDGGFIRFVSLEEGVVNVELQGSCNGCPSSVMTLKSGIENMMHQMLPGKIKEVRAIN
jgi:Fe-S cluster biogenesis protein NfuA